MSEICKICNNDCEKLLLKYKKKLSGYIYLIESNYIGQEPFNKFCYGFIHFLDSLKEKSFSDINQGHEFRKILGLTGEYLDMKSYAWWNIIYYKEIPSVLFFKNPINMTICIMCKRAIQLGKRLNGMGIKNIDSIFLTDLNKLKKEILLNCENTFKILETEFKNRRVQENNSRLAENKRIKALENKIIKLLKSDSNKLPASDIDAILKHTDVGEIRGICEELYHDGKINRTGNYRYFIYDVKPKKKTGSLDVAKEIKDFAKLKEEGFITEAEFKAKKAKLLDL